jgi:hypothetical protein
MNVNRNPLSAQITEMELIGQGSLWEVYKIENQNNVFRIPIGSSKTLVNNFIKNFELIKDLGVPTLKCVRKFEMKGHSGILCDNINYSDEIIYVTHNSLCSDSQKLLQSWSKDILGIRDERKSPLAEAFRYENKITELTNFQAFINNAKSDLKIAANKDILIELDSYFFGTQKQKTITNIDYKIVDLDHIFTNTYRQEADLFALNLSEFYRAIEGFLRYFVIDKSRNKYLEYLYK